MPDVLIGIVSWNTAPLLDRCLASLPDALGDLDAAIVVVDNASSDASVAVAARHDGVRVVANNENVGYARAMNQALRAASAPVLLALNPDVECPPGSLAALVATLRDHIEVGVVVPRLVGDDDHLQHSVYRFPSLAVAAAVSLLPVRLHGGALGRRFWLEGHARHERSGPVDWAIGAVHVIRADALGGEPPYRERWFMYVEDLDLCWRLRRRGWRTWLDASTSIRHTGNAAGVQAWGEARTARWLDATYDWYALERGRARARAWALVNVSGLLVKAAWARLGLALRVPGAAERLRWYVELRGWIGLHGRKLVRGPSVPLHRSPEPPAELEDHGADPAGR